MRRGRAVVKIVKTRVGCVCLSLAPGRPGKEGDRPKRLASTHFPRCVFFILSLVHRRGGSPAPPTPTRHSPPQRTTHTHTHTPARTRTSPPLFAQNHGPPLPRLARRRPRVRLFVVRHARGGRGRHCVQGEGGREGRGGGAGGRARPLGPTPSTQCAARPPTRRRPRLPPLPAASVARGLRVGPRLREGGRRGAGGADGGSARARDSDESACVAPTTTHQPRKSFFHFAGVPRPPRPRVPVSVGGQHYARPQR